jgi:hypothetical protein
MRRIRLCELAHDIETPQPLLRSNSGMSSVRVVPNAVEHNSDNSVITECGVL